jgi:hypothetical protein
MPGTERVIAFSQLAVKGLKIFQTWLFFNEKILIFKFVT